MPSMSEQSCYSNCSHETVGPTPLHDAQTIYPKYSLGDNESEVSTTSSQDYSGRVEETTCCSRIAGFLKGVAKGASGWSMLRATYYSVSGRKGEAFEKNPYSKTFGALVGLPLSLLGIIVGGIYGLANRESKDQHGDISNDQINKNWDDRTLKLWEQQSRNHKESYIDADDADNKHPSDTRVDDFENWHQDNISVY